MQFKPLTKLGIVIITIIVCGGFSTTQAQFALGADVSWLPRAEARGCKYYDFDGKQGDLLTMMKGYGINAIRLRTWINPNMNDDFSGHCSQKETIAMAIRCKKLGYRIMIDFHYHNTWVSVGKPATPKEWANMNYTQMKQALYDYARNFCLEIRDSGVTPEWFQNGNETNAGLCTPTGSRTQNPVQMTGLLNSGYDAIKSVFPNSKVMIHVAQPQKTEGAAMLDAYIANKGKLDAIGWSSYAGSGNVDGLIANVKSWHDKYKLETYMVEIGNSENQANRVALIDKWNAGIEAMNNPCEGGTFYWEPDGYCAPFNWPDALFDASGKAQPGWNAYKTPLKKACTVTINQGLKTATVNSKSTFSVHSSQNAISISQDGQFQYKLYNLNGQVFESGIAHNNVVIGNTLKCGIYLVNVSNQNQNNIVKISKY